MNAPVREVATHCPYCAFQCGIRLGGAADRIAVRGDEQFPVNRGRLCAKGWTASAVLFHSERILQPLRRNPAGELRPCTWDEALGVIAGQLQRIQRRCGRDAVGVLGSGALTNEKAYLLGKFARVALRTPHIDYNGRFCMASAAAAAHRALGVDRGLPFPLEDLPPAQVVMLVGGNVEETMPPFAQYLDAQRALGGRLIVLDPRATPTARRADLHLQLAPGTDAALANGLLHLLVRDGMIDASYIDARTEGFEQVRASVAAYWPERVERITGVSEAALVEAARMLGGAKSGIILSGRGPEQQSHGVDNALGYINLALARGWVGRPFSGYGALTGQGNGQGGREHGQKSDQLPGYRRIDDPAARRHLAAVWEVPEEQLPGVGRSAYEILTSIGDPGGVRAMLILGTNVAVSAPATAQIEQRLRCLEFLAVSEFFLSETAASAHVVLPAAQFAEEEGTLTNLEGRVVRRRRAVDPPPGVRTDLEMLCALAARLGEGARFQFSGAEEVFEELRRASAGGIADYGGITWARLDAGEALHWPCPSENHSGTPRLFTERFPTPSGRARFHPVRHVGAAEVPDPEFPLYLTTGRLLAHYQSGTQTRRVPALLNAAPAPRAQIHPATARRYAIGMGDVVTLTSRRGAARLQVELTPHIREDTVFVPFHWGGEQAINRLTHPALDPVSRMPEFKVCAVRVARASSKQGERS